MNNHKNNGPYEKMLRSLRGTNIGDCYGESHYLTKKGTIAFTTQPWRYSDDTIQAKSLYDTIKECGVFDQDTFSKKLLEDYRGAVKSGVHRGFGAGFVRQMNAVNRGENWKTVSMSQFDGQGSCGNGAAMRVAPLGAFYDHPEPIMTFGSMSADVTHYNNEARAGAIAIAYATAFVNGYLNQNPDAEKVPFTDFKDYLVDLLPTSITKDKIRCELFNFLYAKRTVSLSLEKVVETLGNGSCLTCQDTVPFVLYCVFKNPTDAMKAMNMAVRAGGDVDTTCAMIGGILYDSVDTSFDYEKIMNY